MQPQPPSREEAWEEAGGPPVGERVRCLDLFVHYNGDKTTAMWRPAVVVEHVKEGGIVREIKVHFEGFSAGYDKWISWPRERKRFATLDTSGSRIPSDPAEGSFDGLAVRSSDTDSRSNSSVGGDGSAAATTRRTGFSRLKVFGAMKGLRRSRGNSSTEGRTPTLTPPLTGPSGSSFSPAKAGQPQASTVVRREDRGPAESAALAALCFEDGEFKHEEKGEGGGVAEEDRGDGAEESKRYQEDEQDRGLGEEEKKLSPFFRPAPPSPSIAEEESKQQEQRDEDAKMAGGGSGPPPSLSFPASAVATAAGADAATGNQREDSRPLLVATTAAGGSVRNDASPRTETVAATASEPTPLSTDAATTAEQPASPAPAAATTAPWTGSRQRGGWRSKIKSRARRRDGAPAADAAGVREQTPPVNPAGARSPGRRPAAGGRDRTDEATSAPAGAPATALSVDSSPFSSDVDLATGVVEAEGKWEWRGMDSDSAPARSREEAEAATAALMQETARRQPIRELTPHLVEELDGEGAGFTLTVFKNNKQDQVPVPLVCGKYSTAYEADRAAEAFSSPVWHEPSPNSTCAECQSTFRAVLQRRRHHCRNCGRLVCTTCALRFWPKSMLPHSYRIDSTERRVRVCRTCYSAGKNFRRALLQGSYLGAMEAYSTGCVNLRVPYSHISEELPVHCAAAGGNVSLLAWLMEDRCCPIFMDGDKTVALLDAKGRSVMAAAAESGQIEMMRYLSFTQPSNVTNMGMETLWRGLQACLRYDEDTDSSSGGGGGGSDVGHSGGGSTLHQASLPAARGGSSCYKLGGASDENDSTAPSSATWGDGGSNLSRLSRGAGGDHLQAALEMSTAESGYDVYDLPGSRGGGGRGGSGGVRRKNACVVCFSRKVNATLVPCGHHVCCMPCTEKFELCPVCRVRVTQKIKTIDG
eukprot:g16830.t1